MFLKHFAIFIVGSSYMSPDKKVLGLEISVSFLYNQKATQHCCNCYTASKELYSSNCFHRATNTQFFYAI